MLHFTSMRIRSFHGSSFLQKDYKEVVRRLDKNNLALIEQKTEKIAHSSLEDFLEKVETGRWESILEGNVYPFFALKALQENQL